MHPIAVRLVARHDFGDTITFVEPLPPTLARVRGAYIVRHAIPAWRQAGADTVSEANPMSQPVTIHGIRSCDTMKKARAWLDAHGVPYAFHDYKTAGVDRAKLEAWARTIGWDRLFNRAGTTFRNLSAAEKQGLDEAKALALMLALPSLIKRPVLEIGGTLLVGFDPERYAVAFS